MSIEMIEPVVVPDVFISGIGSVEDVGGGVLRFTFYVHESIGGRDQHVAVAKLLIPASALPAAILTACEAVDGGFTETIRDRAIASFN